MTVRVRLAIAVTAFALLAPTRGLAADTKLLGAPDATGTVANFTGAGIAVSVADNATTDLSAKVTGAGGDSACSNSFAYVEDSSTPETTITAGPAGPTNNASPSFSFSSSKAGSSFECRLDSTEASDWAACASPKSYSALAEGPHSFEVKAIDAVGNVDPSPAARSFTIDTAGPDITSAPSFAPKRFAVGAKPTAVAARAGKHSAPIGSKLKLSLSEAATVTVTIARSAPGRKAGHRCVAPTRSNKSAKKCTRYLPKGALRRKLNQGAAAIPFSGRIGKKALSPGGYRATLTAQDAAGNLSQSKSARFTIVG